MQKLILEFYNLARCIKNNLLRRTKSSNILGVFQSFENIQSFSALKKFCCARAQLENLRSRSIFSRPCARAQNVLSAAQFCAHFKVPKSFQSA